MKEGGMKGKKKRKKVKGRRDESEKKTSQPDKQNKGGIIIKE